MASKDLSIIYPSAHLLIHPPMHSFNHPSSIQPSIHSPTHPSILPPISLTHPFNHPPIHSSIQKIFTENLLCARACSRPEVYNYHPAVHYVFPAKIPVLFQLILTQHFPDYSPELWKELVPTFLWLSTGAYLWSVWTNMWLRATPPWIDTLFFFWWSLCSYQLCWPCSHEQLFNQNHRNCFHSCCYYTVSSLGILGLNIQGKQNYTCNLLSQFYVLTFYKQLKIPKKCEDAIYLCVVFTELYLLHSNIYFIPFYNLHHESYIIYIY